MKSKAASSLAAEGTGVAVKPTGPWAVQVLARSHSRGGFRLAMHRASSSSRRLRHGPRHAKADTLDVISLVPTSCSPQVHGWARA